MTNMNCATKNLPEYVPLTVPQYLCQTVPSGGRHLSDVWNLHAN